MRGLEERWERQAAGRRTCPTGRLPGAAQPRLCLLLPLPLLVPLPLLIPLNISFFCCPSTRPRALDCPTTSPLLSAVPRSPCALSLSTPAPPMATKVGQGCMGMFSKAAPTADVSKLKPGIALPHVTLPTTEASREGPRGCRRRDGCSEERAGRRWALRLRTRLSCGLALQGAATGNLVSCQQDRLLYLLPSQPPAAALPSGVGRSSECTSGSQTPDPQCTHSLCPHE